MTIFLRRSKSVCGSENVYPLGRLSALRVARVGCAIAAGLGSWLHFASPAFTQSDTPTEEQLFQLCSSYPYNSQCEGYEAPIPLSQRKGDVGACALNAGGLAMTDRCKVSIEDNQFVIYVEQGEPVNLLEGERRTQTFTIELPAIDSLVYREDESINQERIITNTLLFGVWGTLFTRPDKISQLEILFADATASTDFSEPAGSEENIDNSDPITEPTVAPANNSSASNSLMVEVGRGEGRQLRESLEQITGLTARAGL